MNTRCFMLFSLILFLLLCEGCTEKKHNPFCFNCEKGTLYLNKSGDKRPAFFIRENGDTLTIISGLDSRFKSGSRVCINLQQPNVVHALYINPFYAKCIKEL